MLTFACATPAPPPAAPPAAEEKAIGRVYVTASVLNVRGDASMEGEVLTQARRGEELALLEDGDGWLRVRTSGGESGWVSERFVSRNGVTAAVKSRKGCPADSDYAFLEAPKLGFSERGPHGLVIVEAKVSASGNVTATRVVSNSTGSDALGSLAEREIREAKFEPPIVNCAPREFFFMYRRTF